MITLLPQQSRLGTFASPIVAVPTGAVTVVLQAIMNAADVGARHNVVSLCVIWSSDLHTPGHAASCVWQSGYFPTPGGGYASTPPGLRMGIPPGVVGFAGQLIMPQSLDIGLAMDILDSNGNTLLSTAPAGSGMPVAVPVYPVLQ